MGAVNSNSEREENDFYATPPGVIFPILPMVIGSFMETEPRYRPVLLDPACGDGNILRTVHAAHGSSISLQGIEIDQGRAMKCVEHLARDGCTDAYIQHRDASSDISVWGRPDIIIQNPPFKIGDGFARLSLVVCQRVAILQRLDWIAAKDRADIFDRFPCDVIVIRGRPRFRTTVTFESGSKQNFAEYAWFWFHPESSNRWMIIENNQEPA